MKEFEIYLSDLTDECREDLIDFLGGTGNYDVLPICIITKEDEE